MYDFAHNPVQGINTLSEYSGKSVNAEQVVQYTKETLNLKEYLVERRESACRFVSIWKWDKNYVQERRKIPTHT